MVNRSQISPPISLPKRSVRDLRWWMFRLSITRWMVSASGYCIAKWKGICANSNAERSGVGKVKCRPALGSTAQKTCRVKKYVIDDEGGPLIGCVANRQSGTETGDLVLAEALYLRAFQRFGSGTVPCENAICNTSKRLWLGGGCSAPP